MVLTAEQQDRRRTVMQRSTRLGHCICDARVACPCAQLRNADICHCAGEVPAVSGPVRLTEHVRNPGCASKVPKSVLARVLEGLPEFNDPRVLAGAAAGDDAGVIVLSADVASIFTVDVFAPCVDDPYEFGQIAAANSLSDIYAMGGRPQAALSVVGFPTATLPESTLRDMLRGGIEKMAEAGVAVIGGHSLQSPEPFCGFAVLGTARPSDIVRNAGAQVGDAIVLTKPLGSGMILFARQLGLDPPGALAAVTASAKTLNRAAGAAMSRFGVHAATDVTGFSLLGHMAEIVRNSAVVAEIDMAAVPLFAGAADLAQREVWPGALERNRESVPGAMVDAAEISAGQRALLYCPETSGGMLVFLPADRAAGYVAELRGAKIDAHVIGRVTATHPGGRIRITRGNGREKTEAVVAEPTPVTCCSDGHAAVGTQPAPALNDAFRAYMAAVTQPGALDAKHKKLIALALSVAQRCEECVVINTRGARDAGANDVEIAEAAALGIAFGGAPAAMAYNKVRSK